MANGLDIVRHEPTDGGRRKPYVVGIGASAGGLEAIIQLIRQLKSDTPCAYVVLQHLSPAHRSMMVEILSRETALKVQDAGQGDVPEQGTIYVVPSNYNAIFKEGRLRLVTAQPEVVPKPSINQFLISLAAEQEDLAVGIILSGTGSDGVAGLRAIQAAGGFTFAQKPDTAKYDGMPRSAIEAGVVDHILTPEEIASRLPQLLEIPAHDSGATSAPDLLEGLLGKLREKLQFDFSGYKVGTLTRRIRRREIATGNHDLASYLQWVDTHPQELELLARDILISVTAFFRDRDAFEVLKRAIQEICNRKPPGSEIRVWTAGCASGEEAYSIAMLFAEALGEKLPQYRLQIFATDIDDDALNVARRGVYPAASMAEVPPDLLERFFKPVSHAFEAGKLLRDLIVFARHNLVSDPPFLRQDLVTCRNVLIYFDAPLQAKVFQTFHFGLVREGYLFLGRSESVAQAEQLFSPIDRRERLFRKTGDGLPLPGPIMGSSAKNMVAKRDHKLEVLLNGLVDHFELTAALCDHNGSILHTVGEVESYLQFPVGSTRLAVADTVVPALRGELMSLMHRCLQTGKPQRGRRRKHGADYVRLFIEPLTDSGVRFLVALFIPEKPVADDREPQPHVPNRELEDELVATREHLQTLVEEMATANEEMQALNEEAQASNEELQATNEEMEAANEELQATNEELVSLNEELNVKTVELSRLSEEYAHLYDSLLFPILVFDRVCQLVRFNAPAARRFDLRPTALRHHVSRLRLPSMLEDLETLLGRTLAHADRVEKVVNQDDRTFNLAVTPGIDKAGEVIALVVTLVDVTEIAAAQAELSQSQTRLSALMAHTSIIFAMKDTKGEYLFANRRFLDFFHLDDKTYIGRNDFDLLERQLASAIWSCDLRALREGGHVLQDHAVTIAGKLYHLRTDHQVLFDPQGQPTAFIIEAEDVTQMRHAEEQLRITARVFEQAGEAIVVTDQKSIIQTVNAAFTSITGYASDEAVGQNIGHLLKSGRHRKEFYVALWRTLGEHGFWQGEIWNKRKNGDIYPQWLTINRVNDGGGAIEHYVAVFSDISSIKDSQRNAEFLATHDTLTGLPNRTLFHDRLRHGLSQARRNKQRTALLFIDLDNFKVINDTVGHDVGDDLLKQAAQRLRAVVRDVDTVARLGGDEFTAILSNCDHAIANQIAQRIIDDLATSYQIESRSLYVTASVGVAFYPEDGTDSGTLIKAADTAMYRAKEAGRNRIAFFKPEMHTRLLKRTAIESGLRDALGQGRFALAFQPKFSVETPHRLLGAEALLRWNDPVLGQVSPAEFIPVAESSGQIREISRFVVTSLLQHITAWQAAGLRVPRIAFNASARNLHESDFGASLITQLQDQQVNSSLIQVEITEGTLLENNTVVINNLQVLHGTGIGISIDDFGTGYSSLAYLKRLPLNELKIDKSFVDGLGTDRGDEAITVAILGLAKALGLHSVAEGVETEGQLAWLRAHGCEIVQGYLFSKPVDPAIFEDLLAKEATKC